MNPPIGEWNRKCTNHLATLFLRKEHFVAVGSRHSVGESGQVEHKPDILKIFKYELKEIHAVKKKVVKISYACYGMMSVSIFFRSDGS